MAGDLEHVHRQAVVDPLGRRSSSPSPGRCRAGRGSRRWRPRPGPSRAPRPRPGPRRAPRSSARAAARSRASGSPRARRGRPADPSATSRGRTATSRAGCTRTSASGPGGAGRGPRASRRRAATAASQPRSSWIAKSSPERISRSRPRRGPPRRAPSTSSAPLWRRSSAQASGWWLASVARVGDARARASAARFRASSPLQAGGAGAVDAGVDDEPASPAPPALAREAGAEAARASRARRPARARAAPHARATSTGGRRARGVEPCVALRAARGSPRPGAAAAPGRCASCRSGR